MKRGWQALVALVLFASAVPLVQAWLDRRGEPRGTLQLTHRELMVGWNRDENSGETLVWSWISAPDLDSVPEEQLATLGIRCRRSMYNCSTGSGRRGWMVVGLDLERWNAAIDSLQHIIDSVRADPAPDSLVKHKLIDLDGRMTELTLRTSRLHMVAIGTDPNALAAEWGDGQHLILAAKLDAYRNTWPRDTLPGERPLFRVHAEPLPSALYVPARWAEGVRDTIGTRQQMYEATVVVGRRWLPRVVEVKQVAAPEWRTDLP